MCPNQPGSEETEVESYIRSLPQDDKDEVKAYLAEMLSNQLEINCGRQQEGLPKALVTRLYLERVIPDEETARAYLQALKEKNSEIREIEDEKRHIAIGLVDPFSEQGESHRKLLEHIWESKGPLVTDVATDLEVFRIETGGTNEIFNTWAKAEFTRVKMQSFIKNLAPPALFIKKEIIDRTKIQQRHGNTKIPIRDWLIAASLVAQAEISPTPTTLKQIIPQRATANRALITMRLAMMENMEAEIAKDAVIAHGYQYVDDMVRGFRLYFKQLGKDDKIKHRNDIVIKHFGNMIVVEIDKDDIRFNKYTPSKASKETTKIIENKFNEWCRPHRQKIKGEYGHLYLYEFAYRYNLDKKRYLGWSLINEMLRILLDSRWVIKPKVKNASMHNPTDSVNTYKAKSNLWDEIPLMLDFNFND